MAKQADRIAFKSMPEWVVECYKADLIEDIDNGIIKTMSDAFYFTKGYFGSKDCVPIAVLGYINNLHTEGRLQ